MNITRRSLFAMFVVAPLAKLFERGPVAIDGYGGVITEGRDVESPVSVMWKVSPARGEFAYPYWTGRASFDQLRAISAIPLVAPLVDSIKVKAVALRAAEVTPLPK